MVKGFQGYKDQSRRRAIRGHDLWLAPQRTLSLFNRQRVRRLDLRLLRRIVQALLRETWPNGSFDLVIYVVAGPEMTRLNEAFLHHKGSTDVITFDYAERAGQASRLSCSGAGVRLTKDRRDACPTLLHGEIFVCLDQAVSQARRFHATWQSELVRYVVHGALHLLGYGDQEDRARRRMKAAEDTLVRQLARQFDFRSLGATRAGNRV
jgi:rRNA maturation RNase YbeY